MESIVVALALVIIGYTVGSVKIINQGTEALVERLGRFHRKLTPGLNFIVPFLDSIVLLESTRERVLDIAKQKAVTADSVSVDVDAVMYWRILQLERTYYAVEDVEEALANLVTTTLRSEIGRMNLAQTFSSRNEISQALLHQLDDATATWGVKVTRVELQEILPPADLLRAMEMERAAESKKKAAISEAQGKKQASIEEAQGAVQSMRLIAEALQEHPNSSEIMRYLVAQRYVDANMKLGDSPGSKVLFMDPKALNEALSELLSTKTDFGIGGKGNSADRGSGNGGGG